jgi:adenylosuccinate synthase
MKKVSIVLGLGYGDEGKGNIVNSLVDESKTLVVRFNGGNQAGHTVIHNGKRHIFSSFGSGTLKGAATYFMANTALDIVAAQYEYGILKQKDSTPKALFINTDTPIITYFDVLADRLNHKGNTVGTGFGNTIEREENHYHLKAGDLFYPKIVKRKLQAIYSYYKSKNIVLRKNDNIEKIYAQFEHARQFMIAKYVIGFSEELLFKQSNHIIFEGAQGTMLDKDCGFFPYVTRSNTTMRITWPIIYNLYKAGFKITTYYVTRCYVTKHGKGDMIDIPSVTVKPDNTNVYNKYQGDMKYQLLSEEQLQYALDCNNKYNLAQSKEVLIVTNMDRIQGNTIPIVLTNKNKITKLSQDKFKELFKNKVQDVLFVDTPEYKFKTP